MNTIREVAKQQLGHLARSSILFVLPFLVACTATDGDSLNFNLMSDEEIVAYNDIQERIWTEVICIRQVTIRSRIRKRHCMTASQWNKRGISSAEQLNIISFGTPQIFH